MKPSLSWLPNEVTPGRPARSKCCTGDVDSSLPGGPSQKTGIGSPSRLSGGALTKSAGSFGTCPRIPPTRHMRVRGEGARWRHCDADDMELWGDVVLPHCRMD